MNLLRSRPVLVTLLLILVYGSGSVFVTAFSVIFAAAVITFICFSFKIQIDADIFFAFICKHYELFKQKGPFKGFGFASIANRGVNSDEIHSNEGHDQRAASLRDLPRPIARKLKLYIDGIMQDFVKSWYDDIGPGERQFVEEAQRALEIIAVECYKRICNVDTKSVAVSLICLLTKHLKIFNDCCNAVHSKYPGIRMDDFEQCIIELYETKVVSHITSKNQGTELDFLRSLTDMILYVLVPRNAFSCEGGRFMLREILAINGLYKLVDLISDPHFVNKALIDIFEEATPLAKIIEQWKEEEKLDICDQDNQNTSNVREDLLEFDIYESDNDEKKALNESSRIKGHSDSSIDHLHEISDNIESSFGTPKQSTTELSSADESYDAFDRVLRLNQLEARLPAPVYGSTMVKLYEQVDEQLNNERHLLRNLADKEGLVTETQTNNEKCVGLGRRKHFSAPDILKKAEEAINIEATIDGTDDQKRFHNSLVDVSMTDVENQLNIHNSYGSWNFCPPSSSDYYNKSTYKQIDKRQDLLQEKLKARLHALGSNIVTPVSCFKLHEDKSMINHGGSSHSLEQNMKTDQLGCNLSHPSQINNIENIDYNILKVHSVPDRNIFYEIAPSCPTCIEMTTLANPFEIGKAMETDEPQACFEHGCGLSYPHLRHTETCLESITIEEDRESFVSCESENLTDLDISTDTRDSESTLLASTESTGNNDRQHKMPVTSLHKSISPSSLASSMECFEVVSIRSSDSEFSSVDDYNDKTSDNARNDKIKHIVDEATCSVPGRAPSITTFASAHGSSTHENEAQSFTTPSYTKPLAMESAVISGILKKFRTPSLKSKKTFKQNLSSKLSKTLRSLRYRARTLEENFDQSSDDEFSNYSTAKHPKVRFPSLSNDKRRDRHIKASKLFPKTDTSSAFQSDDIYLDNGTESEDSFSGATDTDNDITFEHLQRDMQNASHSSKDDADEIVDEIATDFVESEVFEDAKSEFQLSSSSSSASLSSHIKLCNGEKISTEIEGLKMNYEIPIYRGEVIMPHPSKIPVSAWMYPIQMISIPKTEVAFEKGWEPGGNKYTLYNIHYDIRIWPEIYKKQLLEASQKTLEAAQEALPLIREIKRRYREFMYLHNRLTHSHMSEHMKGVLRPNRRYAMPFGRMDPDVIAGRRKILESYLVSLVSRQDVCNSKEFKEFLGAEGFGNAAFIKPKLLQPKQVAHKFDGSIKGALTGIKDGGERSENSRYFIHGYEVPRMFGYAEIDAHSQHSSVWFSNFIIGQMENVSPPGAAHICTQNSNINVLADIEFFQRPQLFKVTNQKPKNDTTLNSETSLINDYNGTDATRTNGDILSDDVVLEGLERKFSVGIPALFSNEFAARKRTETLSTLDARKAAEKIPWPLSDAIMSFICEALKGYNCWLTYENVQQALLYSLGGLLEWQILRIIKNIIARERWMKYLDDLYHVIWEKGKLKDHPPKPNEEEKIIIKQEAVEQFLNYLPAIVRVIIGSNDYKKWAKDLLHAVQYEKINRHVLYAVIELILGEFIPELKAGFSEYKFMNDLRRKDLS